MTATVTAIRPPTDAAEQPAGYTAPQVCDLAGITYRQLDYWTRVGLLVPDGDPHPGHGYARLYGWVEVLVALIGKQLIVLGFETSMALAFARQAVKSGGPISLGYGLVVIDPAGVEG